MVRCKYTGALSALSALVFLFVLIFIIYSNTFHAAWHLDDYQNISQNPQLHKIKKLNASTLWASIHSPVTQRISRPIAMLSFAFNWYIDANHVIGYHVVNLLIHLLTAYFLYLTILSLLKVPNLKYQYKEHAGFIAILAAVLWAIHPIQTQAVTYIVQRMAAMAAMFYIFSLYCYVKARLEPVKKYRCILYLCCGISFLLGVGSKENAATLPIALGLVEIIFFQSKNDRRTQKLYFAGLFGGAIIIFVAGILIFKNGNFGSLLEGSSFRSFSPIERLMTEPRIIVFYLSQIFYPIISRYSINHDVMVSTSLFTPWTTLPAIILIFLLVGIGLSQMWKRPILSFAILFFILNHLIESSILSLELIFEHRNYLPSFFLFLPIAIAVKWLLDYYQKRNKRVAFILVSFVTIFLTLLGAATYIRNQAWATERSLWEDAAKKAPGSNRPLHNLAWAYYERIGEYDTALHLYEEALNRQMNNTGQRALILNNMAGIHFHRGNFQKAAELWQAAVIAYPNYVATKYRLALVREKLGQTQEALDLVDEIIAKRPGYLDSLMLKGTILLKQGRWHEALPHFKKCLNRNPFNKEAILHIGIAYNLMKQYDRARWFLKLLHARFPEDRSCLLWLIQTNLKCNDTAMVESYTDKLLHLIRIEELNSIITRANGINLMDSPSRELVLRQIFKRLTEYTEKVSRQTL